MDATIMLKVLESLSLQCNNFNVTGFFNNTKRRGIFVDIGLIPMCPFPFIKLLKIPTSSPLHLHQTLFCSFESVKKILKRSRKSLFLKIFFPQEYRFGSMVMDIAYHPSLKP